ncbi:MAG TPA: SOS response-associated peptidase [Terriglobales bacterium]|nr:SOS response-associated peptidase [Terriglobales bacterium]
MCGRYRLSRRKQVIEEHFSTDSDEVGWVPRYNIPPTQFVPVIRQNPDNDRRQLSLLRWGLVPSWSRDMSKAASMINARAETADTKPAFSDALRLRRCLIPADGFYEWQKAGKTKQPYCFEVGAGELFGFAGIWESWNDPNGGTLETFSILTTTPNALTVTVHDRMPVILQPRHYYVWLNREITDAKIALDVVKPFEAEQMRCFPVSTRINHAANDDAECAAPVEIIHTQRKLFA